MSAAVDTTDAPPRRGGRGSRGGRGRRGGGTGGDVAAPLDVPAVASPFASRALAGAFDGSGDTTGNAADPNAAESSTRGRGGRGSRGGRGRGGRRGRGGAAANNGDEDDVIVLDSPQTNVGEAAASDSLAVLTPYPAGPAPAMSPALSLAGQQPQDAADDVDNMPIVVDLHHRRQQAYDALPMPGADLAASIREMLVTEDWGAEGVNLRELRHKLQLKYSMSLRPHRFAIGNIAVEQQMVIQQAAEKAERRQQRKPKRSRAPSAAAAAAQEDARDAAAVDGAQGGARAQPPAESAAPAAAAAADGDAATSKRGRARGKRVPKEAKLVAAAAAASDEAAAPQVDVSSTGGATTTTGGDGTVTMSRAALSVLLQQIAHQASTIDSLERELHSLRRSAPATSSVLQALQTAVNGGSSGHA